MAKKLLSIIGLLVLLALTCAGAKAQFTEGSYHSELGQGTGTGMLERWNALYNFSFQQQGGVEGWEAQDCADCHVGADWRTERPGFNCLLCHESGTFEVVTVEGCLNCHWRETFLRGDRFTIENDVHIASGFACQSCHLRTEDKHSDHQFLKGMAIDTTEPTLEGTVSCTRFCHLAEPHVGGPNGGKLNQHTDKVACETCHTGARPASALESRDWTAFDEQGKPLDTMRGEGWIPGHSWYDNTGPGAAGQYEQPILDPAERKDVAGARIYPFNPITVDWYVKHAESELDDVIIVPEVQAADSNGDGRVTIEEMRAVYPGATLLSHSMNYSVSHSVRPAEEAFSCTDCHGSAAWLLDWAELGYPSDPGGNPGGNTGDGGPGGAEKRTKG